MLPIKYISYLNIICCYSDYLEAIKYSNLVLHLVCGIITPFPSNIPSSMLASWDSLPASSFKCTLLQTMKIEYSPNYIPFLFKCIPLNILICKTGVVWPRLILGVCSVRKTVSSEWTLKGNSLITKLWLWLILKQIFNVREMT